jgi:CRISPR-associated protein (TIGR02584 family)
MNRDVAPLQNGATQDLPDCFPRRILLALTGLSPQVVTETVYALAIAREPPFIPTEVHLITTAEGAERARLALLDADDGRFLAMQRDYPVLARTHVAAIHVVHSAGGAALDDIRTHEDNRGCADSITDLVRTMTADSRAALHVSIAGGRKTMGFYLGYALSLYGRPQDRLSHVLVSEPFEADHQFYYPPPKPRVLIIRDRPVSTANARLELAEIPFVRLRDGLPSQLLAGRSSFTETVSTAQRALAPAHVFIDTKARLLLAGDVPVRLRPAELAFYTLLARRRKSGLPGLRWSDPEVAAAYLAEYQLLSEPMSGSLERATEALADGMTEEYFEQRKAKVNRMLQDAMGDLTARSYVIVREGRRPLSRYALSLPPSAVQFAPTAPRSEVR